MATFALPIGLRLLDSDAQFQLYYTAAFELDWPYLNLATPSDGDQDECYVRTDAGATGAVWDHADFVLPSNYGAPSNAAVYVQYHYSNTPYDLTVIGDRADLDEKLNGDWLDQADMRLEDAGVGRYRYLRFLFTTGDGNYNSQIYETSFTQFVRVTPFTASRVEVLIDGVADLATRVVIVAGSSLDLELRFRTNQGAQDLSTAQIQFALHRSAPLAAAASSLSFGPVSATVMDAESGLATVSVPAANTLGLVGSFVGEIKFTNGDTVVRRQFEVEILRRVIQS